MMADASERMTNAQTAATVHPDEQLLSALVEFSAAAGHEINNPLGVILGRVQLLLQQETDPSRRQSLETIAGQAWRIRDMIGDVMGFADPPPPTPSAILLNELADELATNVSQQAQRQGATTVPEITVNIADNTQAWGDRDQLATVIGELLHNALHPSAAATAVTLSADVDPRDERFCRILVRDDGRGLTTEEASHLFNPFYSGRQAGRGLGFGLSKAWRLATINGGTLKVSAQVADDSAKATNCETEFQLRWPRPQSDD